MTITDEMIVLAWNAMRPSHCLRPIEAHEAAEMKAAIAAALDASPGPAAPAISEEIHSDLVAAAGLLSGHGHKGGARAVLHVLAMLDRRNVEASDYGSTDFGFEFAGITLEDGDKRLMAMLIGALGSDHPAINDMTSLLFRSRADGGSRETSLALCIKQLAWLLRRKDPESKAAAGAIDLLRRFDLLGTPLRECSSDVPANVPTNLSSGAAFRDVGTPRAPDPAKNVPGSMTTPEAG